MADCGKLPLSTSYMKEEVFINICRYVVVHCSWRIDVLVIKCILVKISLENMFIYKSLDSKGKMFQSSERLIKTEWEGYAM